MNLVVRINHCLNIGIVGCNDCEAYERYVWICCFPEKVKEMSFGRGSVLGNDQEGVFEGANLVLLCKKEVKLKVEKIRSS